MSSQRMTSLRRHVHGGPSHSNARAHPGEPLRLIHVLPTNLKCQVSQAFSQPARTGEVAARKTPGRRNVGHQIRTGRSPRRLVYLLVFRSIGNGISAHLRRNKGKWREMSWTKTTTTTDGVLKQWRRRCEVRRLEEEISALQTKARRGVFREEPPKR